MIEEKLYTVKEAQKHLRVSMATIRSWIHQNRIPVVRMGRRVLIQESLLKKVMNQGLEKLHY